MTTVKPQYPVIGMLDDGNFVTSKTVSTKRLTDCDKRNVAMWRKCEVYPHNAPEDTEGCLGFDSDVPRSQEPGTVFQYDRIYMHPVAGIVSLHRYGRGLEDVYNAKSGAYMFTIPSGFNLVPSRRKPSHNEGDYVYLMLIPRGSLEYFSGKPTPAHPLLGALYDERLNKLDIFTGKKEDHLKHNEEAFDLSIRKYNYFMYEYDEGSTEAGAYKLVWGPASKKATERRRCYERGARRKVTIERMRVWWWWRWII